MYLWVNATYLFNSPARKEKATAYLHNKLLISTIRRNRLSFLERTCFGLFYVRDVGKPCAKKPRWYTGRKKKTIPVRWPF